MGVTLDYGVGVGGKNRQFMRKKQRPQSTLIAWRGGKKRKFGGKSEG